MVRKGGLNLFERGLAKISPSMALNRAAARERLTVFEKKRNYDGGRPNRSNAGWNVNRGSSANTEIMHDLTYLRERSRDLVRNNPWAKRAVQIITTNVTGTGVRPSIPKGKLAKVKQDRVMDAWRNWAETTECDFNGQFNFYGLMMQAWRASVESGDGILHIIRDPSSPTIPVKLKLYEADYLDHTRDGQTVGNDGNYIVSGVEFTKAGKRVAYWLYKNHPSDMMLITGDLMSVRVPASDIIHIYEVLRPGQVRGIPHGVAAFIRLKNLDDFEDAQLVRQKIAACFSVFIRKNDANFLDHYEKTSADEDLPPLSEKIAPGIMEYLQPGEDISFANPPGTTGYEPYTRSNLRAIAAAYLITYEALSGDLSTVNFSSGRMGWLEQQRQIAQWQEFIIKGMFCQPIWNVFLLGCRLKGIYTGDPVLAEWTPPRREMIDPVKEAQGMRLLIRAGLTSRSEEVRSMGWDPEVLFKEICDEQHEANIAGLMLDSDGKWDPTRVNFGIDAYLASKVKAVKSEAKPEDKKS
jgi:lambda family phage portal protein